MVLRPGCEARSHAARVPDQARIAARVAAGEGGTHQPEGVAVRPELFPYRPELFPYRPELFPVRPELFPDRKEKRADRPDLFAVGEARRG